MKQFVIRKNGGFTLIEVILIIVVASIMAVMMFTYSNTSFTKGSWSLTQTKKTYAQQKVMENIFTDYNLSYKSNIVGLQTKIGNTASQQDPPAGYGQYTVVDNYFINFSNGIEIAANSTDKNILKVTIQNDHGETLSMLFTNIAQ